jgi:hypothetical protein
VLRSLAARLCKQCRSLINVSRGCRPLVRDVGRLSQLEAALLNGYWPTLDASDNTGEPSADRIRSILMNYERSLIALRRLAPREHAANWEGYIDTIPFQRLTDIYLGRLRHVLDRPELDITDVFKAVPMRRLTRAYFGRLALAASRRARRITSRLR